MDRRSNKISGWVDFPVNDSAWRSSGEGGMVVKLVVCDNRPFDDQFGICCGASVTDVLSESLVGDDKRQKPVHSQKYESVEDVKAEHDARNAWMAYHFPRENDNSVEGIERYLSREYMAAVVIGSTGWSGWSEEAGEYWQCAFDDLTDDGKALYRQVEKLYSGCELHLLTYLDT
jgi:hypothetical protein